ncbi:MAG: hypothetical protein AAFW83_01465 [Pseudomonadota bacterium]
MLYFAIAWILYFADHMNLAKARHNMLFELRGKSEKAVTDQISPFSVGEADGRRTPVLGVA